MGILPANLLGIATIEDYELSEQVELYIEPYDKNEGQTLKRSRRVDAIKAILDKNHIIHSL